MPFSKPSFGNIITLLAMFGSIAAVWVAMASDQADVKRRVLNMEERTAEDRREGRNTRREIKEEINEVKKDVKETKEAVHTILIKIERMERRNR